MISLAYRLCPIFVICSICVLIRVENVSASTTEGPTGNEGFVYRCTGTMVDWDGITYVTVGEDKAVHWGPCGFPNPYRLPYLCGQDLSNPNATHACDPDHVLINANGTDRRLELDELSARATEDMDDVSCPKDGGGSYKQKVQIVVALVKHMRTVDMNVSGTICHDSCGQVVPLLSPESRPPTQNELRLSAQTFPEVLRSLWQIGYCDNDIVIFFLEEHSMITGSVGGRISGFVPRDALNRFFDEGQAMYRRDGEAYDAIEHVITNIVDNYGADPIITDNEPAYMLLIILLVVIAVFLVGFGLTYHFGQVSDYWDEQWWEKVIRWTLYFLFGIFIIKGILYALVTLQEKAKPWWLAIPLGGVVACIIAAIVVEFG